MPTIDLVRPPLGTPRHDLACAGEPRPAHRDAGLPEQAPSPAAATGVRVSAPAREKPATARPPRTVLVLAPTGTPGIAAGLRDAEHALDSFARPVRTGLIDTSSPAPGALRCTQKANAGRADADTGPEPLMILRHRAREPRIGLAVPNDALGPSCPRRRARWYSAAASAHRARGSRRGVGLDRRATSSFAAAVLAAARVLRDGQR